MRIPSKYLAGIFLLSFSTLLFELSLTRVFSVTLWYHFGFLIISTALLGFGVSGVAVSISKKIRETSTPDKMVGWMAVFLGISVISTCWLLQRIPFDPFSLYTDKRQLLYMPLTYLLVATPFFFAGLALSLLFTRYATQINRLYAADLAGAALGCVAIVFSMPWLGGGGSVLLAASFASLGAILFFGRAYKPQMATAAGLLLLSLFLSFRADHLIPLRITSNKRSSSDTSKPVFTQWNTFSKIDLYVDSSRFAGKLSPTFYIDEGTAATGLDFDLRPDVVTALKQYPDDTLYASCLAYLGYSKPSVLVIGSGAGTEVLDALHYGAGRIVAVDINPIINRVVSQTMNDLWGNMFHRPSVEQVTDEGRNYVRSSHEKFDAIVSVHTISNAAMASGALSLAENYVLTREAFEDYYDHLNDSGVIYFTRPEFQLPRLFATGREVLEAKGVPDPAKHFLAYTYPVPTRWSGRKAFYAIFLMSKAALAPGRIERMKMYAGAMKDERNRAPVFLYDPAEKYRNIYDSVLSASSLPSLYARYPFEISPATDNRPFFNHHTRWSSIRLQSFTDIFSQNRFGRLALEDKPIAEVSLIILLVQVILIAAVCILLPLWRFSSAGLQLQNAIAPLLYFSGLGMGFIMVEIVLIQQFGLLLGEPVYTLTIVLAGLLLFTGVGAYLSGRFSRPAQQTVRDAILLLSLVLFLASCFLPMLLRAAIPLSLTGRIIFSIILIMPVGILLGIPFPSGIRMISYRSPRLIPWAWGVNGFFTVIGSVMALMLSMMIGFQAVLWTAILIYLACMLLARRMSGSGSNV